MTRWKSWTAAAGLTGALGASFLVAGPTEVAEAAPSLKYTTVVSGLTIPWDLTWVGPVMLFDERDGDLFSKRGTAAPRRVSFPLPKPYVNSEGGLLGLVADPKASTNKLFYTCSTSASAKDVRVLRWRLTSDTRAVAVGKPLVTGIPLTSGRHTGCRLRFSPKGVLYIGTGDAAVSANPQKKSSLGGKVLRVYSSGTIPKTNPFYASGGAARYVWNYGHRNIQGLAVRPATGQMFTAEHGSYRDDEVNLIRKGANYGWDPGPGYDESVPMTDRKKFPKAVPALWSSGNPTVATSGMTFLSGKRWETWNGALAVAELKGEDVRLLFLDKGGKVTSTRTVPGADRFGRIRTLQQGPDGLLYLTTSNGGGKDRIIRVTPS
ncbi:PQQ-dependent sugar dehydrogenase [Microlunatus capsulatus]|uniref:Glucose/arabinose dehydrogenase n=1 Tax=Microlunatus capsulatus TaxID=99117 RepID=A0ABS4Z7I9_9ACTN|nr:PQQ-dependent sugar dehydrogenase [Microlunatus capsulatus]MBP2417009.1 glucose/arabinose dehydrogenase [Microlunatus capsulatus]